MTQKEMKMVMLTAPIRSLSDRDHFSFSDEHGLQVAVPCGSLLEDLYSRASLPEIKAHLLPNVKLTRGGKVSGQQDPRPNGKTYSWWLAQCLHYGLGFPASKEDAQVTLRSELVSGHLKVPDDLKELEKSMRRSSARRRRESRRKMPSGSEPPPVQQFKGTTTLERRVKKLADSSAEESDHIKTSARRSKDSQRKVPPESNNSPVEQLKRTTRTKGRVEEIAESSEDESVHIKTSARRRIGLQHKVPPEAKTSVVRKPEVTTKRRVEEMVQSSKDESEYTKYGVSSYNEAESELDDEDAVDNYHGEGSDEDNEDEGGRMNESNSEEENDRQEPNNTPKLENKAPSTTHSHDHPKDSTSSAGSSTTDPDGLATDSEDDGPSLPPPPRFTLPKPIVKSSARRIKVEDSHEGLLSDPFLDHVSLQASTATSRFPTPRQREPISRMAPTRDDVAAGNGKSVVLEEKPYSTRTSITASKVIRTQRKELEDSRGLVNHDASIEKANITSPQSRITTSKSVKPRREEPELRRQAKYSDGITSRSNLTVTKEAPAALRNSTAASKPSISIKQEISPRSSVKHDGDTTGRAKIVLPGAILGSSQASNNTKTPTKLRKNEPELHRRPASDSKEIVETPNTTTFKDHPAPKKRQREESEALGRPAINSNDASIVHAKIGVLEAVPDSKRRKQDPTVSAEHLRTNTGRTADKANVVAHTEGPHAKKLKHGARPEGMLHSSDHTSKKGAKNAEKVVASFAADGQKNVQQAINYDLLNDSEMPSEAFLDDVINESIDFLESPAKELESHNVILKPNTRSANNRSKTTASNKGTSQETQAHAMPSRHSLPTSNDSNIRWKNPHPLTTTTRHSEETKTTTASKQNHAARNASLSRPKVSHSTSTPSRLEATLNSSKESNAVKGLPKASSSFGSTPRQSEAVMAASKQGHAASNGRPKASSLSASITRPLELITPSSGFGLPSSSARRGGSVSSSTHPKPTAVYRNDFTAINVAPSNIVPATTAAPNPAKQRVVGLSRESGGSLVRQVEPGSALKRFKPSAMVAAARYSESEDDEE